ncbi:MAG: response regulator [Planctomycetota bacterium]
MSILAAAAPLTAQRTLVDALDERLSSARGDDRLELLWRRTLAFRAVHLPAARDAAAQFAESARALQRPEYEVLALLLQSACEIGLAHGEVGASLRTQALALPAPAVARLAGHRELLLCRAASRALRLGEAVRRLQAARACVDACDDAWLRAGYLLAYHGLLKSAGLLPDDHDIDDLVGAVRTADAADHLVRLDATTVQLEACVRTGRDREAADLAAAALARADAEGDPLLAWQVHSSLLWQAWQTNRFDEAVEQAESCELLARRLEDGELLAASLDGKAWSHLLAGRPEGTGAAIDLALEHAAGTGLPMLELRVLDSAVNLAIARQDGDALLRHATKRKQVVEQTSVDSPPGDREQAIGELRRMLGDRRAREEAQQRRAERRAESWQAAIVVAAAATLGLAGVLFAAKRRLERANRRLVAETERVRASESARQQLEHQMRHLERLDSVGLLAAGIAHDFNNLLTGIRGNAELLSEAHPERDGPTADILAATDRAAALCRKMLDHTRPHLDDTRAYDLREITTDLRPLLAAISSGATPVELELSPAPVLASVDRSGLEQVLLNLCTNAVEASPPGAQVRVGVRTAHSADLDREEGVWFGPRPDGTSFAVVEVIDQGRGIPHEQLRRVFDPFFTTRFEGRGLGLSVAYGVVTALGGVFCVASRVDLGTRFSIYLPAVTEGAPEQASAVPGAAEPTPTPDPPSSVLVVDDDETVRGWLQRSLRRRGCRVYAAADGADARRLFAAHPESVVLLDVSMPGEDGPTLYRELRRIRADARIVVISGHDATTVRARFPAEPTLVVVQKPFRIAALLQTLAAPS